jgi:uncharacterized membrane protein YhiD involved in acid resistance
MEIKKAIVAIVTALCVSTIMAATKAYVDVERLKVKVSSLFDYVKETRDDVKEVKKYLLRQGKR